LDSFQSKYIVGALPPHFAYRMYVVSGGRSRKPTDFSNGRVFFCCSFAKQVRRYVSRRHWSVANAEAGSRL